MIKVFKIIFGIFFFLLPFTFSFSQDFQRQLNSIPFSDEEGMLSNIFSGGINNLDFQFVDIDGDDDYDIFFLDSDGTIGWYENSGNKFSPSFGLSFDTIPGLHFSDWFYLVDIDNDNDYDLFTAGIATYIQLIENTGTRFSPSFTLKEDTLKTGDGNPIFSEFGSNPVFADVDSDGDYDFISGNSIGTLNFFENTGTAENLNLKFITQQWQDIIIISGGSAEEEFNTEFYNENRYSDSPATADAKNYLSYINPERHGASSIEFADIDNDGDADLFWGDFFSRSLYFIENQGTPAKPGMKVLYEYYPQNQDSLLTSGFNMPRLVDIDGDNDLDLFVSVLYDPTVPQSLIYYKNEGTFATPDFSKITDHYLKTLDVGIQSLPVFEDIDADGDLDLFIGSSKNPNGTIYFFENTGNISNPFYFLRDSLYAGIQGELSAAPAFGDLNGDGKSDLLVGNFNGTISFYLNDGSLQQPHFIFQDSLYSSTNNLIDIGIYARPFLIDVDSDDDLDLITGRFNGRISFFKNIGSQFSFAFEEDTSYFSTTDVGDNSTPFLIDYDSDGDLDLFSGNRVGNIFFFNNDGNNISPVWNLITSNFLEQNFGGDTAPVFVDIDNDTDIDLFIGNSKGGLYFYRNSLITDIDDKPDALPENFSLSVYPNPFNSEIKINLSVHESGKYILKIFNSLGEEISEIFTGNLLPGEYSFHWNDIKGNKKNISSGVYFISAAGYNKQLSAKIIYLK